MSDFVLENLVYQTEQELRRLDERAKAKAFMPAAGDDVEAEAARIAEVIKEVGTLNGACSWQPCSGCHETNEGAETGRYPYSARFECFVGFGCHECGGLGVTWEHWDEEALKEMQSDTGRFFIGAPLEEKSE